MFQPTVRFTEGLLANAIVSGTPTLNAGILNGKKAILFTGSPLLSPTLTYAQLTEADFAGYAQASLTFTGAYLGASNTAYVVGGLITIAPSGPITDGQSITGWGLITPNGDPDLVVLLGAELFNPPIVVFGTTTPVQWIPKISLPPGLQYGSGTQL